MRCSSLRLSWLGAAWLVLAVVAASTSVVKAQTNPLTSLPLSQYIQAYYSFDVNGTDMTGLTSLSPAASSATAGGSGFTHSLFRVGGGSLSVGGTQFSVSVGMAGWSYQGCFKDNQQAPPRAIPDVLIGGGCTGAAQCEQTALSINSAYNVIGLQNRGECWAGINSNYAQYGATTCVDPRGDAWKNEVYTITSPAMSVAFYLYPLAKAFNGNDFMLVNGLHLQLLANTVYLRFLDPSGPWVCHSGPTVSANVWTHVVVTWTSSLAALYLNGTLACSQTNPAALTATSLTIGGSSGTGMYIDELFYFSTALSASQVANMAQFNYPAAIPADTRTSIQPYDPVAPCTADPFAIAKFYYYFGASATVASNTVPMSSTDVINDVLFWQSVANSTDFDMSLVPDCFPYPYLPDATTYGNVASLYNQFTPYQAQGVYWYQPGALAMFDATATTSDQLAFVSRLHSMFTMRQDTQESLRADIISFYTFLTVSNTNTLTSLTDLFVQAEIDQLWSAIAAIEEELKKEAKMKLITDFVELGLAVISLGLGTAIAIPSIGAAAFGEGFAAGASSFVGGLGGAIGNGINAGEDTLPSSEVATPTPATLSFSSYGSGGGGGLLATISGTQVMSSPEAALTAYQIYQVLNRQNGYYLSQADRLAESAVSNYGYMRVLNLLDALESNSYATTDSKLGQMLAQQVNTFARVVLLKVWVGMFTLRWYNNRCEVIKGDNAPQPYKDPSFQSVQQAFANAFNSNVSVAAGGVGATQFILGTMPQHDSVDYYSPSTARGGCSQQLVTAIQSQTFMSPAVFYDQPSQFFDFFGGVTPPF